jgi:glycosyltransferase involved in cell wall biosynthesis
MTESPDTVQQAAKLRAEMQIDPDAIVLGFVGRLNAVKGLKYLLRALQVVIQERSNVVVLLVGEGPEASRLKAQAAHLGIEQYLRFAGAHRNVAPWFGTFDVAVLPSLSEGLPLAVLEAMSSGTPVIASRVGGIPEIIRDGQNGLLIPPRDVEALTHAINSLVDSAADRKRFSIAAGGLVAERFAADQASRHLRELYQRQIHSLASLCTAPDLS